METYRNQVRGFFLHKFKAWYHIRAVDEYDEFSVWGLFPLGRSESPLSPRTHLNGIEGHYLSHSICWDLNYHWVFAQGLQYGDTVAVVEAALKL